MKKLLAVLLAMVMLCFVAGCAAKEESPEDAMQNLAAVLNGDYSKFEALAPRQFWDWVEKNDLKDYEENWEESNEKTRSGALGQYGMDAKTTITIRSQTMLERTDSKFQKIVDFMKKIYGITEEDIEAVCYMDGSNDISGSKGSNSYDHTYIAVKIGGRWYPLDISNKTDFYIGFVGNLAN